MRSIDTYAHTTNTPVKYRSVSRLSYPLKYNSLDGTTANLRVFGEVVSPSRRRRQARLRRLRFRSMSVDSPNRQCIPESKTRETSARHDWARSGPFVPLLVTPVRLGRELDDGMQRNLDIRQIGLRQVMEVRISAKRLFLAPHRGSKRASRSCLTVCTHKHRRIAYCTRGPSVSTTLIEIDGRTGRSGTAPDGLLLGCSLAAPVP